MENRRKLWGNCAFPQNFQTRKLGKIMAFYAVFIGADPEKNRLQTYTQTIIHDSHTCAVGQEKLRIIIEYRLSDALIRGQV